MGEAQNSFYGFPIPLDSPTMIPTPYGGQLIYTLLGKTRVVVHLKNKAKIRNRKRWSQVMYMYFILCHIIPRESKTDDEKNSDTRFPALSEEEKKKLQNTFLLALDGDVDFKPKAVSLLVDRMEKNLDTGAACGRIHPIGSGPMVWYQNFEYAIGHWFQKSTEHVLGCVLCSPGCFSLFRGSSLISHNVLKKYTSEAEEAQHHVQWDQGEDRWLCTLLIQAGYRVDYTAASDAMTYCPENFKEFFLQRRRWMPSTLANIFDLLSNAKAVMSKNNNISIYYIIYQFFLMVSTILGPATILLSIAAAFTTVFPEWELWVCYGVALGPAVFYIAICFTCKSDTQIIIGGLLSTLYTCVMLIVLVSIIQSATRLDELNPSLVFIVVFAAAFVFAGLVHPQETGCLVHGILYFLTIPSGYLILVIYSMCNLHVTSWGTRESTKAAEKNIKTNNGTDGNNKTKKKKFLGIFPSLPSIKEVIGNIFPQKSNEVQIQMIKLLNDIHDQLKSLTTDLPKLVNQSQGSVPETPSVIKPKEVKAEKKMEKIEEKEKIAPEKKYDEKKWCDIPSIEKGDLEAEEEQFWTSFVEKYLQPIKKNKAEQEKIQNELLDLRNNINFGIWLVNGLWVLLNYMLQADTSLEAKPWGGYKFQPIGLVFMLFFALVLLLQLAGMMKHRWGTFLQILSTTKIFDDENSQPSHKKIKNNLHNSSGNEDSGHERGQEPVDKLRKILRKSIRKEIDKKI